MIDILIVQRITCVLCIFIDFITITFLCHVGKRKHRLKDHFSESSSASAIPVVPMTEMITSRINYSQLHLFISNECTYRRRIKRNVCLQVTFYHLCTLTAYVILVFGSRSLVLYRSRACMWWKPTVALEVASKHCTLVCFAHYTSAGFVVIH